VLHLGRPYPQILDKGLPGTNTLAYYENLQITAVKRFIVQPPEEISTKITFKQIFLFKFQISTKKKNSEK
jgi:hypothetical protein